REDLPGERRLVAYVVSEGGGPRPGIEELRSFLVARLPEYMVPAIFIELPALPLTPNGKLDRRGLPAPGGARPEMEAGYVAPRTATEEGLCAVWSQVLSVDRVGIHDNFFTLGGDSILSLRVLSLAAARGLQLSLPDLFRHQTVAELATVVVGVPEESPRPRSRGRVPFSLLSAEDRACLPEDVVDAYPLTHLQAGMLYHMRLTPGEPLYHNVDSWHLKAPFDVELFREAVRRTVARHPVLRTSFDLVSGREPFQRVHREAMLPVLVEDLRALTPAEQELRVGARIAAEKRQVFDLGRPPQLRFLVHLRGPDTFQFTLVENHAILDGWSLNSTLTEIFALHFALLAGESSEEPPPISAAFRDYVALERETLASPAAEAFWNRRLDGWDPVPFPRWPAPKERMTPRIRSLSVPVPSADLDSLRSLARRAAVPIKDLLLAVHLKALSLWTGREDVLTGVAANGRLEEDGGDQVRGLFLNTLPLRFRLAPGSWLDLIRAAFAAEQEMLPWRRYPYAALQRRFGAQPITDVNFNYIHFHVLGQLRDLGQIEVLSTRRAEGTNFTLNVNFVQGLEGEVGIALEYDAEALPSAQVEAIADGYARILRAMAAKPDARHDALSPLPPAAAQQLFVEWNGAIRPQAGPSTLDGRFAAQAAATPEAVAAVYGEQALSYGELDRRAARLAHHLRALGVAADVRVGLCLERSLDWLIACLAVLKAGGAYLPLDPSYPRERLALLAADAPVLVTEERLGVDLPPASIVYLDRLAGLSWESAELPGTVAAESLAYVLFTSGSTGVPKGVAVPHGGVIRLVCETDYATFDAGQVFLQLAPLSFDAATLEIWGPLLHGGCLVIPPPGPVSLTELGELLARHGVTTLWLTAGLFQRMVEENLAGLAPVRQLLAGGDVLSVPHVERVLAELPGTRFVNGYGPTESTTFACCFAVRSAEDARPSVPLGRPIANTSVYLLGRGLRPVPIGVPAELCIGGEGLARGYLDRPELTAERFVPNPFVPPGSRLYRTGDLARWSARGGLEFLGRIDGQVKVRGFRVEPGEIEAILGQHPEVREVAVIAREDRPGDRRLVAYLVAGEGPGDLPAALRSYAAERLPGYLVPAAIVVLPALPLTANGKVDRRTLPAPEWQGGRGYRAPRTPVEEVLAGFWGELLGLERVGIDDGFFELGGHSLLATQVISRVRQAFGLELPLRELFEAPTVAGLAERVERARGVALPTYPPLVPVSRVGDLPLSFAQQRLWFIDQLAPGSTVYNVPMALRARGPLSPAILMAGFAEIERRHAVLRTTFALGVAGQPVQTIHPPSPFALPVIDLSGLPGAAGEALALRLAAEEARRPFDLARGPLLRATLLRSGEEEHVLLFNFHHIVGDGWSIGLLVREVSALYEALRLGHPSPLPELAVQYADFAIWQRGWLSGEVLAGELAYWRDRLAGVSALLELPTDRPRPPVQSYRGAGEPFVLSGELTEGLRALSRRAGGTLFMSLLAAYSALLARYSGQRDVCVGTPIAGRTHREIEDLIGFFINTLVLRADLSGNPGFDTLLARVRRVVLEAFAHQDLPFEMLIEALQPERSLSHEPLFQVMLNLHNMPRNEIALSGLGWRPLPVDSGTVQFDLILTLAERLEEGGSLAGQLDYRTDLFDRPTIRRFAGHLRTLLAGVVAASIGTAASGSLLSELPLLTAGERQQLLAEWGDVLPFAARPSLHRLFEEQARRAPGSPAVVMGVESLTYGQLDRRADRLARRLRQRGVGPEVVVGVCLERSLDLVVAILGVLKAGGAYLPLDPAYPEERLAFLLADAGTPVLVTARQVASTLPRHGAEVVYLEEEDDPETIPTAVPDSGAGPENLAYVIYTSGSTGRPRGVQVTHGNVGRLLSATAPWFGFGPRDVWTLFHSYAFDFSVWEIWGALAYGGSLVIVPYWVSRSPESFYELLGQEGVTVLNQTPSAFRQLMRAEEEARTAKAAGLSQELALRLVIFGGEALELQSLRPWVERHGAARPRLVNMYGITETTVHVTYRPLTAADIWGGGGSVVGWAIPDLSLRVVDLTLQPQPVGVPGELCISGAGLARGYLNRPELTAERFVPDPWGTESGTRLYRSGDLVRRLPDGDVEYLGRIDHQVKVRGFRIELGEIEAALGEEPGVREAVVIVREDEPGDRRLVAYVVGASGAMLVPGDLRAALKRKLPEPLVPSAIVLLDVLPLTVNGKVDRRALPALESGRQETGLAADRAAKRSADRSAAARGPVEELLGGIWEEVLRLDRVGREENFFELGGHSLLATQVASRVRQALGVELPLRSLFERPTVAALAPEIERELRSRSPRSSDAEAPSGPPIVPATRGRELEVSFAQQRMWFLDQLAPGSPAYNMPVAFRLTGRLDRGALAASLREIVRRHETLRTTFAAVGGRPVPTLAPVPEPFPLPLIDLTALPDPCREDEERRLAREDGRRPFNLLRGPVFRGALLRLGEERHAALFNLHHIASDGWSTGVLVGELAALYPAVGSGRPSPLPELPVQYSDFAAWQNRWLSGDVLAGELGYWRQALAGLQPLDLPADRPRPAVGSARGGSRSFALSPALSAALARQARAAGATLFMNLLAGFFALLARYTGHDDVAVGSAIANRNHREIEGLIGFFVNTLVLRVGGLAGRPSFRELLGRVRSTALGAFAHQDLPFERLVEELQPERDTRRTPLFEVMFILQNLPGGGLELPGLTLSPLPLAATTAKFDLNLVLAPAESGLTGTLTYRLDLFDRTTVDRLAGHFATLLAGAVDDPEALLPDLPILTGPERQALVEWNGTAVDYPEACLHELIAEQTRRSPEATAVVFADAVLTYGELDRRANRLARHLRRMGVGPEVVVGLCLERSLDLMVGLLGVLQAGGAYLPLDPSYPRERLARMLEDTRPTVLLVQERTVAALPAEGPEGPRICLDSPLPQPGGALPFLDELSPSPENLAYVIFTSGSTGRPKGAMNSHRAIVNRLLWTLDTPGLRLSPADRALQKTPISYDFSVWELFAPLVSGACVVLALPEGHRDPAYLARLLAEQAITISHFVPPMLQAFLSEPGIERMVGASALRRVMTGGEAISVALQERLYAQFPEVRLFNQYGPTEAAVDVTAWASAPGDTVVPIGRPLANTRILIKDAEGRPVPVGIPGELYIGGVQVARGYLGRPGLTAERFLPDSAGEPGARLYRTGDIARHLHGGEVEYLGRGDHQVKIRGIRIELGEIEAALTALPAVRQAVVLVRGEGNDRRLMSYLTVMGVAPTVAELRLSLGAVLPEPMVPAAFVVLDALPLMPSGKVDRSALGRLAPALDRAGASEGTAIRPGSPVEEMVAGIWADVLGLERVGAEEDFFALGGHSLLATQVMSRVRAACSVDLPLRALFERPTVAGLAGEIESARRVDALPPIARVPRDRDLPLSFAQQRLWFLDRLGPGRGLYNIPFAARLSGALSIPALAASLNEIARRHESLRTHFHLRETEPVQVISPDLDLSPALADLGALPEPVRAAEVARLAATAAARSFDLGRGPLLRSTLLRLDRGGEEHALLLTLHHTITDGWSTGIFLRELSALYGGFLAGRPVELPPLPIQYADFAVWQRQWLAGERLEGQLAFWRQRLAGAPALLELPTDRPRPAIQTFRGGMESLVLPADLAGAVQRAAVRQGATLFMLLLAAFDVVLARHSGQEDVVVGTPVANRNRLETEGLIGLFVNTLVLRADLGGEPTFRALLGRVREMALAAYAHQDVPFERLVEELAPDRSLGRTPLFQVMFAVESGAPPGLDLPGLTVTGIGGGGGLDAGTREAKFDLGFAASLRPSGLAVSLDYNADLFDRVRMRRMLDHLGRLLTAAVADPEVPWPDLPLLGEGERQQLLLEWNATRRTARPTLLHELFAPWAAATPGAPALLAGDRELGYAALAARVDGLARRLRVLGVRPEVRVGILAEPSIERVVALLAVLRAGGAYVPLDPDHPAARTERVLTDAAVSLLLADRGLLSRHPVPAGRARTIVALDDESVALDGEPTASGTGQDLPLPGLDPRALAYAIYTSGSTGVPNGVLVPHGAATNLIHAAREVHGVRPGDRVLHFASFGFDAALLEIFLALSSGAGLVIASREERVPGPRLPELLRREVSHMVMTPSVLSLLPEDEMPSLRMLSVGGESCPPDLLSRWASRVRLLNCYGPTETAIYSLSFLCQGAFSQEPPIGRPIANTEAYLLDGRQQPVPAGTPGELCLGGEGLARGYLGRPELTAARFVPDPFSGRRGGRLYRTGDLARFRPDGNVFFLGRIDNQVKVRGLRIELGEIEATLREHPGVGEAAVITAGEGGDRRLVAHVVPSSVAEAGSEFERGLREYLKGRLPAYMLPSNVVIRDALPLTATGKLDRKALAATGVPSASRAVQGDAAVPPRDAVEAILAGLFSEVLGLPSGVGVTASFFDLGGHSLLAVRLMSGIKREFGRDLPLSCLFEAPTVERLAILLHAEGTAEAPWSPLVPLTARDAAAGRQPFFCIHPVGGSVFCYRELAAALGPGQPFLALQARGLSAGEPPFERIEEMAAAYVEAVRATQPAGPYLLGGWSF
ncbi:MAG: hypothetical protein QOJ16_869, partial [Acidobacteriota bacterium]|nr:hypothetical protein [Acidobacteriota bacterium]